MHMCNIGVIHVTLSTCTRSDFMCCQVMSFKQSDWLIYSVTNSLYISWLKVFPNGFIPYTYVISLVEVRETRYKVCSHSQLLCDDFIHVCNIVYSLMS